MATLYQHIHYGGYARALPVGDYRTADLQARGARNNDISSLHLAAGHEAILYDGDNFTGQSYVTRSHLPNFVPMRWNDKLSSLRIRKIDSGNSSGNSGTTSSQGAKGDRGPAGPQGERGPAGPQGPRGVTGSGGDSASPIYNNARDAIVTLRAVQGNSTWLGSGFFYTHGSQQYIITVAHLIISNHRDARPKIFASISNAGGTGSHKMLECRVIGVAGKADIAVLSVLGSSMQQKSLSMANSKQINIGESCFVLGDPLGIDAISISSGVVRDNKYIYANTIESMCISAPIYSGNSGSPIVNKNGEVIGIISYGVGDNEAVSSISWGCSSSIMQLICTQIIANNQNFVGKSINARLYPVDSHYLISRGKYNYALEGYYADQSSEPALTRLQHIITHINGKHLGVYYNQDTPTKEVYLNLGGAITARIVDGNTGQARDVSLPLTYISAASDIPLGSGADSDIKIHRIGPIKKDFMR